MPLPSGYHEAHKQVTFYAQAIIAREAAIKRFEADRNTHKLAWRKETGDLKRSAREFNKTVQLDGKIREENVKLAQARYDKVHYEREREQALRASWFSWKAEEAKLMAKVNQPKSGRAKVPLATSNTATYDEKEKAVAAIKEIEKELKRLGV